MNEAILRMYLKEGDYQEIHCLDIKLDNGMLIIIYKQFSDDLEDPILEGYSLSQISSFELIRIKGDEADE